MECSELHKTITSEGFPQCHHLFSEFLYKIAGCGVYPLKREYRAFRMV
jgi:hypothetical protein